MSDIHIHYLGQNYSLAKGESAPESPESTWTPVLLVHLEACVQPRSSRVWSDHVSNHELKHDSGETQVDDLGVSTSAITGKFNGRSLAPQSRGNHTGGKPFNCSDCGKGIAQFSNLLTHQWVHTDKKPFNDPECGKAIKRSQELLYHQRVHADEKPFKCSHRGNGFRPSFDFTLHLRRERPFACSKNGKGFFQSFSLLRHQ
ncbi:zinc finger protein 7-like [Hemiscyllium ocellatum]|uniref:zinc finger protein 7-like n=1 Tax=Hemiscyllium ocellatum TaxID=170820 RepID=UPI0029673AEA|nr:zinc finger protein 7-like [Hemiscyllium ocellatum]